jgi:putative hydrolase of the HAD superfamily
LRRRSRRPRPNYGSIRRGTNFGVTALAPRAAKVVRFALEHRFGHIQIEGEQASASERSGPTVMRWKRSESARKRPRCVGDNLEWEIAAPQRLGIYAIWHDGYGVSLPPNSPIRPDRIIRRLSELLL